MAASLQHMLPLAPESERQTLLGAGLTNLDYAHLCEVGAPRGRARAGGGVDQHIDRGPNQAGPHPWTLGAGHAPGTMHPHASLAPALWHPGRGALPPMWGGPLWSLATLRPPRWEGVRPLPGRHQAPGAQLREGRVGSARRLPSPACTCSVRAGRSPRRRAACLAHASRCCGAGVPGVGCCPAGDGQQRVGARGVQLQRP